MEITKLQEICRQAGCRLEEYTPGNTALLVLRSGEPVVASITQTTIKIFKASKIHLLNWFMHKIGLMPFSPRTVGSWSFFDLAPEWLSLTPVARLGVSDVLLYSLIEGLTAYNSVAELHEAIQKALFNPLKHIPEDRMTEAVTKRLITALQGLPLKNKKIEEEVKSTIRTLKEADSSPVANADKYEAWPSNAEQVAAINKHVNSRNVSLVGEIKEPITLTVEEMKTIIKTFEEFNLFSSKYVLPKIIDVVIARGLNNYVDELWTDMKAERESLSDDEIIVEMKKARAAQYKAFVMHSLPIYLYNMAILLKGGGNTRESKDFYRDFLIAQAEFRPDDVDTIFIEYMAKMGVDMEKVIEKAEKEISEAPSL